MRSADQAVSSYTDELPGPRGQDDWLDWMDSAGLPQSQARLTRGPKGDSQQISICSAPCSVTGAPELPGAGGFHLGEGSRLSRILRLVGCPAVRVSCRPLPIFRQCAFNAPEATTAAA